MILGAVSEGIVIKAASPPVGAETETRMLRVPQPFTLTVAVKGDTYVTPLIRFYVRVVIVLKLSVIAQGSVQRHACVN